MGKFSVYFVAGVFVSGLLLTGCSSVKDSTTFTEQDAIAKYKSKYVSDFPDTTGVWQTIYRRLGGPYDRTCKMQVETLVDSDGKNAYIITFNEKWSTIDDPRYQKRPEESFLHHQSKVKVTPDSITFLGESGDSEPPIFD